MCFLNCHRYSTYPFYMQTIILSKTICFLNSTKIWPNTALSDSLPSPPLINNGISPSLLVIKSKTHCFKSGLWWRKYPLVLIIGLTLVIYSFSFTSSFSYFPCRWNYFESRCEYFVSILNLLITDKTIYRNRFLNPAWYNLYMTIQNLSLLK